MNLSDKAAALAGELQDFAAEAHAIATPVATEAVEASGGNHFITSLTVFILACFVGYYVVWKVTPALHSPLMGVTNAISSVIIVGALLALGTSEAGGFSRTLGCFAVMLASVNIFGGFIVTQRMLSMFKKKEK